MAPATCKFCQEQIHWLKSQKTGKSYAVNDPNDRASFHNCRGREAGFSGASSTEKPNEALRATGWVVNPPPSKEKWLEDVLNKAVKACDEKQLDIFKVDRLTRAAFARLLADAEAADRLVAETKPDAAAAENDIPF